MTRPYAGAWIAAAVTVAVFAFLLGGGIGLDMGYRQGEREMTRALAPDIQANADALNALGDRLIAIQDSLTFTGLASWYGTGGEHGRIGADGSRFDMYAFTAAAKRLPFGTKWRVTRLDTGASVVVTVRDDGPNIRGRLIDLSYAAAQKLDMIHAGIVRVRISPEGI